MANIYTDMGSDGFDAMAGGRLSSNTLGWLQDYSERAFQTFSSYGQGLIERSRELYDMIDESSAMQMIRNLGTLRLLPAMVTIGSTLIFLAFCYMLHERDKVAMARAAESGAA